MHYNHSPLPQITNGSLNVSDIAIGHFKVRNNRRNYSRRETSITISIPQSVERKYN